MSFLADIVKRALDSAIASVGTTLLGIVFALVVGFLSALLPFRKKGVQAMMQHWRENLRYFVIVTMSAWALLFAYHVSVVARQINRDAAQTKLTPQKLFVPPAPAGLFDRYQYLDVYLHHVDGYQISERTPFIVPSNFMAHRQQYQLAFGNSGPYEMREIDITLQLQFPYPVEDYNTIGDNGVIPHDLHPVLTMRLSGLSAVGKIVYRSYKLEIGSLKVNRVGQCWISASCASSAVSREPTVLVTSSLLSSSANRCASNQIPR